jgi:hypothetical protein
MSELGYQNWTELGALAVAVIVALTGLYTAKVAAKSAEAQLDAVHALAISQSVDDYQRLGTDLKILINWFQEIEEAGACFVQEYSSGFGPQRVEISGARRNVRLYFQKCAQLLTSGAITKQVFNTIAYKHGLNVLDRIVIPLEQNKFGPEMDFYDAYPEMQIFKERKYKKFGDGFFSYERKKKAGLTQAV